jgi:hypothetical protein
VRGQLKTLAPTYLRDALKLDKNGETVPPSDPQHLILDLVAVTPEYDFTSVFDTVSLQIGAWSAYMTDTLELQESVRAALEAEGWELKSIVSMSEEGWRGCVGTYSTLK